MTRTDFVRRSPNMESVKKGRRFGFWGFCAVTAGSIAAYKIVKELRDPKKAPTDEEIANCNYNAPIDYVLLKDKNVHEVVKCRRKIMELMDLYGCCSEHEILDVMGFEDDEVDLDHKIFDSTTKFKITYDGKDWVLLSQAPREVIEEAENGEHIGDEGSTEESVSGS